MLLPIAICDALQLISAVSPICPITGPVMAIFRPIVLPPRALEFIPGVIPGGGIRVDPNCDCELKEVPYGVCWTCGCQCWNDGATDVCEILEVVDV